MANANFNEITAEVFFQELGSTYTPGTTSTILGDGVSHRVDSFVVSNNDTIDHVVAVGVGTGAPLYTLASVLVPAGAGFGGIAPVDLVALQANPALGGFLVSPGLALEWDIEVAMNTGKSVFSVASGGRLT